MQCQKTKRTEATISRCSQVKAKLAVCRPNTHVLGKHRIASDIASQCCDDFFVYLSISFCIRRFEEMNNSIFSYMVSNIDLKVFPIPSTYSLLPFFDLHYLIVWKSSFSSIINPFLQNIKGLILVHPFS